MRVGNALGSPAAGIKAACVAVRADGAVRRCSLQYTTRRGRSVGAAAQSRAVPGHRASGAASVASEGK